MLQCIAIDDEPLALQLLEDNISKVPYLQFIAACRNAFAAMKVLQENAIDLIFSLQILPLHNGFAQFAS